MARIETDPNYSIPTFSRATAATDLFKKSDVQQLAEALSTHDHGGGKGVAVARLASGVVIPDGSITSAMIADGTIASADIGVGAITTLSAVYGSSSGPTTTSTTPADMPDMTLTINSPVACLLRVDFSGVFIVTAGAGYYQLSLDVDGAPPSSGLSIAIQNAPVGSFMHHQLHGYIGVAAGSHTIKTKWLISAGTLQAYAVYRALSVLEVRR